MGEISKELRECIDDMLEPDYTELAYAYYIDSNPAELSELWYLVDKGHGHVLQDIHFVAQESIRDKRVKRWEERYGAENVRLIGTTYEGNPYSLGRKRYSGAERNLDRALYKHLLTRENYAFLLAKQAKSQSIDFQSERGILLRSDDEIAQEFLTGINREHPEELQYKNHISQQVEIYLLSSGEITRHQALSLAAAFYESDAEHDEMQRRQDADEDVWLLDMIRRRDSGSAMISRGAQ